MKINISKIGAARSQLIEGINLFFEERDPVSIHTLVGASLQILNDHITDIKDVYDNNLLLHYNSIYIKDEARKLWIAKLNEAKNFFKHADKDLKEGKTSIEFETKLNEFNILGALQALSVVEGTNHTFSAEFKVFTAWFLLKNPDLIKAEHRENIPGSENFPVSDLKSWRILLQTLKEKEKEKEKTDDARSRT